MNAAEIVAQAKAKGFTLFPGTILRSDTCGCAVGIACLLKGVDLRAYPKRYTAAAEVLGISAQDVRDIANGFDYNYKTGPSSQIGRDIRDLAIKEGVFRES